MLFRSIDPQDLADQTMLSYPVQKQRLDVVKHFLQPAGVGRAIKAGQPVITGSITKSQFLKKGDTASFAMEGSGRTKDDACRISRT